MPETTVGQELPELRVRVTRSTMVRYSGASTDFNEIHFSDRHARAIGLPFNHGVNQLRICICGDPPVRGLNHQGNRLEFDAHRKSP